MARKHETRTRTEEKESRRKNVEDEDKKPCMYFQFIVKRIIFLTFQRNSFYVSKPPLQAITDRG